MARPATSLRSSGRISGPPSIGLPSPSKTRESISSETPNSMLLPRKRTLEDSRLIPVEDSNNCTSAFPSSISRTRQRRRSPFASSISPSSSYATSSTPRTSIRGPATSCMVLYSFGISFLLILPSLRQRHPLPSSVPARFRYNVHPPDLPPYT